MWNLVADKDKRQFQIVESLFHAPAPRVTALATAPNVLRKVCVNKIMTATKLNLFLTSFSLLKIIVFNICFLEYL